MSVAKEQLDYETKEFTRLETARATNKKFNGVNVRIIEGKMQKIKKLKQEIEKIEETNKGEQ